jgi:hypothetical protein
MSDVIVAKIENRRGLRRDLPQPLLPGELGFCLDTLQLFIGADPDNINSVISPVIETFTPDTQSMLYANDVAQTQVIQVTLTDVNDPVLDGEYGADIVVTAYEYDSMGDPINGMSFLGYFVPPGSIPTITQGPARWFGDLSATPSNEFVEVSGVVALVMDDNIYVVTYAGAAAEVINYVFEEPVSMTRPGIVTVRQNVEIYTETTQISGGGGGGGDNSNILMPGIRFPLTPSAVWIPISGFTFQLTAADAFVVDYSLYDTTNVPAEYTKVGTLHITTDGVTASLKDSGTDIDTSGDSITIEFRAVVTGTTLSVEYITSSPAPSTTFTTNTRRWLSF